MSESTNGYRWVGKRTIRPDGLEKVTGRAAFGADHSMPQMLVGRVLRSPHSHARIVSIDTSKAEALPEVKSVITSADFPAIPDDKAIAGTPPDNFQNLSANLMARGKVLYDGHAVAAVAATTAGAAKKALSLIDVTYEILPHVIDVEEAMASDAPLIHSHLITKGVEPVPEKPSNVALRVEFAIGDLDAGFSQADEIIERRFTTQPVHQGYIEPHAVVADAACDGQVRIWCRSAVITKGRSTRQNGHDPRRGVSRHWSYLRLCCHCQDGRLSQWENYRRAGRAKISGWGISWFCCGSRFDVCICTLRDRQCRNRGL